MKDIVIAGTSISPVVIDSLVRIALEEVDGVMLVPIIKKKGIISRLFSPKKEEVATAMHLDKQGLLHLDVHVAVQQGSTFHEIAQRIRQVVSDAVSIQMGLTVSSIDVYIDALSLKK